MGSEYGAKILANPELRTYFERRIVERFAGKKPTAEEQKKIDETMKKVDSSFDRMKLDSLMKIADSLNINNDKNKRSKKVR